ncbi:MAG: hypothetical protein LBU65_12465 [Planctomycetaceae bacterium]|jgi:glucose-1-phosphate thymidylyltransferase|nr:hypothetical protein [Planctomycetaceae bacterium]
MHIILFEDEHVRDLFPTSIARPAFALNVGTYRLIDLVQSLDGSVEAVVRQYLNGLMAADYPFLLGRANGENHSDSEASAHEPPILVLNARVVPGVTVLQTLKRLIGEGESCVVHDGDQLVCALFFRHNPFPSHFHGTSHLLGIIADIDLPQRNERIPMLRYAHDLIRYQSSSYYIENINFRLQNGNYTQILDGVFAAAPEQKIGQYCVFDAKHGPIVIERGVTIGAYSYFKGPVYLGENCKILEHSAIKDNVTLGATTKVGGEVECSVIEPYSNKQHHGFLGHSYLGSWVNLGAGTCNSDLKNTYGEVVMEYSNRKVPTGLQFVGCFVGDYAKTAINTSIFTGKTIGACSMVYGLVATNVPSFVNYAKSFGQVTETTVEVLIQTQQRMFQRRNVEQRQVDIDLLRSIYEMTRHERQLANEPLSL